MHIFINLFFPFWLLSGSSVSSRHNKAASDIRKEQARVAAYNFILILTERLSISL